MERSRRAATDELIFVAGNPGHTDRLNTVAHLEFLRDVGFPARRWTAVPPRGAAEAFSERSHENARRAEDELFGMQNSRKARLGGLAGLQDPQIMDARRQRTKQLCATRSRNDAEAARRRRRLGRGGRRDRSAAGHPTSRITLLEDGTAFDSQLFDIARTLVRLADENAKPNAERLREYRESNRDSLEQELFSDAPIYDDLETLKLADSLDAAAGTLGADDPLVRAKCWTASRRASGPPSWCTERS